MKTPTVLFRGIGIAKLVIAFLPMASFAADAVKLGNVPPPGLRYAFESTTDMTGEAKSTQGGQSQTMSTTGRVHRIGTCQILAVKNGIVTSIRLSFGDACDMTFDVVDNAAAHKQTPFSYAGKTVTVTLGDDGKVTDDSGVTGNEFDVKELHHTLVNPSGLFPKTPVTIGDEWTCDPAIAAKVMGAEGANDTVQMKMKLLSVKEVGGRPTAEIKVTTASTTEMNGLTSKSQTQATNLYDIATGLPIKIDNHASTTSSGDTNMNGPNGPVSFHSDLTNTGTVSGTIQFLNADGTAAAPMPSTNAPAPAPAVGFTPAPALGNNPLAPPGAAAIPAAPYAGTFSDGKLTVDLSPSAGAYSGTITLGNQRFPAEARPAANGLEGSFQTGGQRFPFTATLNGDTLTLITAGTTYSLKKPGNPLQGQAPAPMPAGSTAIVAPSAPVGVAAAAAPAAAAPTGPAGDFSMGQFTELGSNASGKTLFAKFSGSPTIEAAISQTRKALAGIFDAKPFCSNGFADGTRTKGGAMFTANLKGQAVRGWLLVGIDNGATTVNVIYCRTDAPPADLSDLFAALPGKAKTTTHQFPDGSGSIELPANWMTQSKNCLESLIISGPAYQVFTLNVSYGLTPPDCDMVKMAKSTHDMQVKNVERMNAMSARFPNMKPQPPVPPLDLNKQFAWATFCPYCKTNDDIVKNFIPILAAKQKRERTDLKVISATSAAANPGIPGATATLFTLSFTWKIGDTLVPVRSITRIEWYPVLDGRNQWTVNVSEMVAQEGTFSRDVALMKDMRDSIKPNAEWFEQQNKNMIAAGKAMNDAMQKNMQIQHDMFEDNMKTQSDIHTMQMNASADRFAHQQANVAAQRAATTASSKDMTEFALGLRDVYDKQTGTYQQVDLSNSKGIVAGMNAAVNDPNRFIEIPLRDE